MNRLKLQRAEQSQRVHRSSFSTIVWVRVMGAFENVMTWVNPENELETPRGRYSRPQKLDEERIHFFISVRPGTDLLWLDLKCQLALRKTCYFIKAGQGRITEPITSH